MENLKIENNGFINYKHDSQENIELVGDYNSDDDYDDPDSEACWDDEEYEDDNDNNDNMNNESNEQDDLKLEDTAPKTNTKRPLRTREQDAIATLLSTCTSGSGYDDLIDNFNNQDIHLKDLLSLTKDDLAMLGVSNKNDQQELLDTFSQLPKQAPDYDKLINSQSTKDYNEKILSASINRIKLLKTSTTATNLKLNLVKAEDTLIDENEFASNYVLRTIDELRKVVVDMEDRISFLEEFVEEKSIYESKNKGFIDTTLIMVGITAVSLAFILWKRN